MTSVGEHQTTAQAARAFFFLFSFLLFLRAPRRSCAYQPPQKRKTLDDMVRLLLKRKTQFLNVLIIYARVVKQASDGNRIAR